MGYNACRRIVWDHYVLGEEEKKKESVHEDESKSAVTMLPFSMAGLEVGGGGGEGTGIMKQHLALSVQLLSGWTSRDTGDPQPDRGLSPSTLTLGYFGTDSQV